MIWRGQSLRKLIAANELVEINYWFLARSVQLSRVTPLSSQA
jgi:hypothetical protein